MAGQNRLAGLLVFAAFAVAEGSRAGTWAQQATPPSSSTTAPSPTAPSTPAPGPIKPGQAQTSPAQTSPAAPSPEKPAGPSTPKPEVAMTRAQARTLFQSVDTILKFDSQDTGLPVHHTVKRRLTTRKAVEAFLVEKMKEDKDTARVERSGIVLKKFGLLPADFELRPFLLSLLKEQIAGYYDSKTKTVNLLNWIDPEEQKPVLAHELTHALQDQRVDLDKWDDQSIDGTPKDVADDNRHLRVDESDTAREAALEGQAMVAYMDWSLAPMAQSLRTSPDVPLDPPTNDDKPDPESPVLSRAPLVLKASLLFPYQDGLRFEQILLKDHGAEAAFGAVLDRPPSSSYEIMQPHAYEKRARPALLTLPDLHPLLDAEYKPYDLGVMGALDVRMLGQLFGGAGPAADLALTWDGGVYYAAQRKSSVAAGQGDSTASIGLVYLSQWTTPEAAAEFEKLYVASLSRKYKQLKPEGAERGDIEAALPSAASSSRQRFATKEGLVVVTRKGRLVFVSEGFESPLADRLEQLMAAPVLAAYSVPSVSSPSAMFVARAGADLATQPNHHELTGPLVRLFSSCGMMKAALRRP